MDDFTTAYIVCALWSSTDEDGTPLDDAHSVEDLAPETLADMVAACEKFQAENAEAIDHRYTTAGHDFWLTRNGHGAGFWDGDWNEDGDGLTAAAKAFGAVDLYIGDDGKIHQG